VDLRGGGSVDSGLGWSVSVIACDPISRQACDPISRRETDREGSEPLALA